MDDLSRHGKPLGLDRSSTTGIVIVRAVRSTALRSTCIIKKAQLRHRLAGTRAGAEAASGARYLLRFLNLFFIPVAKSIFGSMTP